MESLHKAGHPFLILTPIRADFPAPLTQSEEDMLLHWALPTQKQFGWTVELRSTQYTRSGLEHEQSQFKLMLTPSWPSILAPLAAVVLAGAARGCPCRERFAE
jgi:hypothetical protein